ncbi:hypothetical protein SAMN04489727_1723 [Amycolatopsis tolypomycina]|uniref:Uncharacterized protein n=1 Tax=Amycolatopsis tolypomycina TaxID=208445 RepID=A0A1H4JC28_9PSEU|nr:hypothetical protein [Amycolatopsis tolypomycina]SEB43546.1 hypothetical protein SAMN04489727_1723 [Amycolatopsis tolypomycina]
MSTAQASARSVTASGAVSPTPCTLRGLSLRDTSGAANIVDLFDNASAASGTVVATVVLAANGSGHVSAPDGVRCANGLYLQATGAVVGAVWVG